MRHIEIASDKKVLVDDQWWNLSFYKKDSVTTTDADFFPQKYRWEQQGITANVPNLAYPNHPDAPPTYGAYVQSYVGEMCFIRESVPKSTVFFVYQHDNEFNNDREALNDIFIFSKSPATFDIFRFRKQSKPINCGIEVYNATGKQIFSSELRYLQILDCINFSDCYNQEKRYNCDIGIGLCRGLYNNSYRVPLWNASVYMADRKSFKGYKWRNYVRGDDELGPNNYYQGFSPILIANVSGLQ